MSQERNYENTESTKALSCNFRSSFGVYGEDAGPELQYLPKCGFELPDSMNWRNGISSHQFVAFVTNDSEAKSGYFKNSVVSNCTKTGYTHDTYNSAWINSGNIMEMALANAFA